MHGSQTTARDLHCTLRRRAIRAFTLVEILAVVVIMGIASAVIIPYIGNRDDLRTSAAARTVVADLIYAQNLAITNGTPVYVRFDLAANSYSLLTSPVSTAPYGTPVQHPITQADYVMQFGPTSRGWESVALDSTTVFNGIDSTFSNLFTVGFDEMGSPYVWSYTLNARNDMKDGCVVLKAGTFTTTVTISPATGELTVN